MLKQTRNLLKRFARDDRGQVAVLMALAVTVLLGMVGFSVDVGSWYREKANLQSAVDAAALAGAQSLPHGQSAAITSATQLAKANEPTGVYNRSYNVTFPSESIVQVNGTEQAPTFFSQIFGLRHVSINVVAQAANAPTQSVSGLYPFGVTWSSTFNLDTPETLTGYETQNNGPNTDYSGDVPGPGNFMYLDYGATDPQPRHPSNLMSYFNNPETYPISVNDTLSTQTGVAAGQVTITPGITIMVPIVSIPTNGKSTVTVQGFAYFYIDSVSQSGQSITGINGEFKGLVTGGPGQPGTNYGVESPTLLK